METGRDENPNISTKPRQLSSDFSLTTGFGTTSSNGVGRRARGCPATILHTITELNVIEISKFYYELKIVFIPSHTETTVPYSSPFRFAWVSSQHEIGIVTRLHSRENPHLLSGDRDIKPKLTRREDSQSIPPQMRSLPLATQIRVNHSSQTRRISQKSKHRMKMWMGCN
ncbi:hypothetical protein AVEN_273161-1 [Araneus ventricosus]|uniref:Uncharacterized protein n=1 Tax=Araneus ventricosus TaxID=182803 RepID=A0A4Y2K488_ARAVE|nr:hypothetical protein AVEN_273161-1 [Araneus ventricosus]